MCEPDGASASGHFSRESLSDAPDEPHPEPVAGVPAGGGGCFVSEGVVWTVRRQRGDSGRPSPG